MKPIIKTLDWCVDNLQEDLALLLALYTYGLVITGMFAALCCKWVADEYLDFIPRHVRRFLN